MIVADQTKTLYHAVRDAVATAVVGQTEVIEQLLITLLTREHAIVEGPAGTAKSAAAMALAQSLGLAASKLRCSADLTLADEADCAPLLANVVIVDDADRLAPRWLNVLQQAMQNRELIVRGKRLPLADPFTVFSTRDPVDHRLPEARQSHHDDRFVMQIDVPFPRYDEEFSLVAKANRSPPAIRRLVSAKKLAAWRELLTTVAALPSVVHYAVRLVRATRVHEGENPDFIYEWVSQGAGPRAAQHLLLAAVARATLQGRTEVTHADVRELSLPVLRHRLWLNDNARSNGVTVDRAIRRLWDEIPPRIVGDDISPKPGQRFTLHDWTPRIADADAGLQA